MRWSLRSSSRLRGRLSGYAYPYVIARVRAGRGDLDEAAVVLVEAVRLPSGDLMDDMAIVMVASRG